MLPLEPVQRPRSFLIAWIPVLGFAAALCAVGLVSEIVTYDQEQQFQRGIDAHQVAVAAEYTDLKRGSGITDDKYVLTYSYGTETIHAEFRSLPRGARLGHILCVELNSERPRESRICGTRGGVDEARNGVLIGGIGLSVSLVLLGVARRRAARTASTPMPVPGKDYDGHGDLVLQPQLTSRWAILIIISLAPAAIAVIGATEEANPLPWAIAAGLLAVLGLRLWHYRVECSAGTIEIHGTFRNRRIPAASVVRVDERTYPVIVWRPRPGRVQSTPLYWFRLDDRILQYIYEHSRDAIERLRIWIHQNRGIT